jgi:hypothetical protein
MAPNVYRSQDQQLSTENPAEGAVGKSRCFARSRKGCMIIRRSFGVDEITTLPGWLRFHCTVTVCGGLRFQDCRWSSCGVDAPGCPFALTGLLGSDKGRQRRKIDILVL